MDPEGVKGRSQRVYLTCRFSENVAIAVLKNKTENSEGGKRMHVDVQGARKCSVCADS